jgi:hypothetical protein
MSTSRRLHIGLRPKPQKALPLSQCVLHLGYTAIGAYKELASLRHFRLIVAGFDALERTDLTARRLSVGSSGNLTGMRRPPFLR